MLQRFQICHDRLWGVLEPQPVCPGCGTHRPWRQVDQVGQKRVGVLGLKASGGQGFGGKMRQVISDDDIRSAVNGGRRGRAVATLG
jgi:hypothetical protein